MGSEGMSEITSEFPEYATAYTKGAQAQRNALPETIRVALIEIEDAIAEDPDQYTHRNDAPTEDTFIYKHPQPQIELTCKIDQDKKVIYFVHVAARTLEVAKPLFISYSHKDKEWLQKLRKFLTPLEKKDLIKIWDDREITAGDYWQEEIDKSLASAKAALVLVSQDFLTSEFIENNELPQLLSAAKDRGVTIFWVALGWSTVEDTELSVFQALNNPSEPLEDLEPSKQNREFVQIYKRIKAIVEET
jgi:hypothetical protein